RKNKGRAHPTAVCRCTGARSIWRRGWAKFQKANHEIPKIGCVSLIADILFKKSREIDSQIEETLRDSSTSLAMTAQDVDAFLSKRSFQASCATLLGSTLGVRRRALDVFWENGLISRSLAVFA